MTKLQKPFFKFSTEFTINFYYLYHLLAINQLTDEASNFFLENCILISYWCNETEKSKNRVD